MAVGRCKPSWALQWLILLMHSKNRFYSRMRQRTWIKKLPDASRINKVESISPTSFSFQLILKHYTLQLLWQLQVVFLNMLPRLSSSQKLTTLFSLIHKTRWDCRVKLIPKRLLLIPPPDKYLFNLCVDKKLTKMNSPQFMPLDEGTAGVTDSKEIFTVSSVYTSELFFQKIKKPKGKTRSNRGD